MSRSKKKLLTPSTDSILGFRELVTAVKTDNEELLLAELLKRQSRLKISLQSIADLGQLAKSSGEIETLKNLVSRLIARATKQVQRGESAYERHKLRTRGRQKGLSEAGRDIAPLPPVKDPERREACRLNLQLALETYWKTAFSRPWSESQKVMIQRAELVILVAALFALAMPRGEGKTTICRHTVEWALLYGHSRFAYLIGATDEKGEESLEVITSDLETNELLLEDFPEVCYPLARFEGIRNRAKGQLLDGVRTDVRYKKKSLVLPTVAGSVSSGSIIRCGGLLSSLRGANHRLADGTIIRPDLVLLDDPQTRESAESPPQSATRIRIVTADVLGLGGAGGKIAALMPCTVIAPGDLADTVLDMDKHPEWQGLRTSMLISFPDRMDLWSEYWDIFVSELMARANRQNNAKTIKTAKEDLWFIPPRATAYYRANRKEMDRGGEVSNEYRKRDDELSGLQHAMNWYFRDEMAFFSEFQNDPKDPHAQEEFLTAAQIAVKTTGYCRGDVPLGVEWITFSIDCHQRALTWTVCGFEPDFTGHLIDYGVFPEQNSPHWRMQRARPTLAEKYPKSGNAGALYKGIAELAGWLLERNYKREDGVILQADLGLIDQGYEASTVQRVLREHGWHNRLIAAFGREIGPRQIPINQYKRRPGEQLGEEWLLKRGRSKGARNLQFDVSYWKTFLARRLATPIGDPGSFSLFGKEPKDLARKLPERKANHDFISRHLDSEVRTTLTDGERLVDQWRLRPGSEDHHKDNIVHCHIAASKLGAKIGGHEAPKVKRIRRVSDMARDKHFKRAA